MIRRNSLVVLLASFVFSFTGYADSKCRYVTAADQGDAKGGPTRAVNLVYDTGDGITSKDCTKKDAKADPLAAITGQPYCLSLLLCGKDKSMAHGQIVALCPAKQATIDGDGIEPQHRWMCSDDADWCYNHSALPKGYIKN